MSMLGSGMGAGGWNNVNRMTDSRPMGVGLGLWSLSKPPVKPNPAANPAPAVTPGATAAGIQQAQVKQALAALQKLAMGPMSPGMPPPAAPPAQAAPAAPPMAPPVAAGGPPPVDPAQGMGQPPAAPPQGMPPPAAPGMAMDPMTGMPISPPMGDPPPPPLPSNPRVNPQAPKHSGNAMQEAVMLSLMENQQQPDASAVDEMNPDLMVADSKVAFAQGFFAQCVAQGLSKSQVGLAIDRIDGEKFGHDLVAELQQAFKKEAGWLGKLNTATNFFANKASNMGDDLGAAGKRIFGGPQKNLVQHMRAKIQGAQPPQPPRAPRTFAGGYGGEPLRDVGQQQARQRAFAEFRQNTGTQSAGARRAASADPRNQVLQARRDLSREGQETLGMGFGAENAPAWWKTPAVQGSLRPLGSALLGGMGGDENEMGAVSVGGYSFNPLRAAVAAGASAPMFRGMRGARGAMPFASVPAAGIRNSLIGAGAGSLADSTAGQFGIDTGGRLEQAGGYAGGAAGAATQLGRVGAARLPVTSPLARHSASLANMGNKFNAGANDFIQGNFLDPLAAGGRGLKNVWNKTQGLPPVAAPYSPPPSLARQIGRGTGYAGYGMAALGTGAGMAADSANNYVDQQIAQRYEKLMPQLQQDVRSTLDDYGNQAMGKATSMLDQTIQQFGMDPSTMSPQDKIALMGQMLGRQHSGPSAMLQSLKSFMGG